MTPRYALVVPLSLVLGVAGLSALGACASAEGAYHDGMDLEVSGDYAAAADAYIRALERDPSLPNVAGRLAVAGRESVRAHLGRAALAGPEAAADAYLAADALVRRAGGVGVDLERPATFAADLDAALDAAVVDLTDRADGRLGAGDFAGTVALLGRARAYRPTTAQAAALDDLARDAYVGWAEADLAAGRYRSALGRTEAALALGPSAAVGAEAVLDLQAAILEAGTVVAAVFPAEEGDDLPRGWLREVDDVLADDALGAPPPFVALVDPAEVRRLLRGPRRRDVSRIGHPRIVADLARDLDADFGVAVEVGPLVRTETTGEPTDERVRLRRGGQATYQRRRVRLRAEADAAFAVVDAASGRVVCDEDVRESVTEDVDRATYSGDWRDLDLSRRERAMFADDALDQGYERALDRLRDATAEAVAERVEGCLARQVP